MNDLFPEAQATAVDRGMPTVTLYQPYASLVAVRAKPYETRSWPAPGALIGKRIAIHAGAKPALSLLANDTMEDVELALNLPRAKWASLPFGAVICTARLTGAYQSKRWLQSELSVDFRASVAGSFPLCGEQGLGIRFGDFRQARWCWALDEIELIEPPVLAKGHQGIWYWQRPEAA